MNPENAPDNPEEVKKQLPQRDELGVSRDYINVVFSAIGRYDALGAKGLIEYFQKNGALQTYEERFPSSEYRDVVTPENQEIISRIDEMVNSLNAKIPDLNEENAADFTEEVRQIVRFILKQRLANKENTK
jgi:hypothetical protein